LSPVSQQIGGSDVEHAEPSLHRVTKTSVNTSRSLNNPGTLVAHGTEVSLGSPWILSRPRSPSHPVTQGWPRPHWVWGRMRPGSRSLGEQLFATCDCVAACCQINPRQAWRPVDAFEALPVLERQRARSRVMWPPRPRQHYPQSGPVARWLALPPWAKSRHPQPKTFLSGLSYTQGTPYMHGVSSRLP
jgi:hypothetical protein